MPLSESSKQHKDLKQQLHCNYKPPWGSTRYISCSTTRHELYTELYLYVLLYVSIYMQDSLLCVLPEWVFVASVALGSVLFLLLVGVCWCQCCPHSCCCYVSCWCCPDTCCCPRHREYKHKHRNAEFSTEHWQWFWKVWLRLFVAFVVYEAGKGIKTGSSASQTPAYPPYFVTGVPTMVPIAPPSLVDKISPVPSSDGSLLTTGEV